MAIGYNTQGSYRANRSRRFRSNANRRDYVGRSVAVVPSGACVPKGIYVKLKFSSAWTDPTQTNVYSSWFVGNGCYNPDGTGVGGQPTGFGEWSAFYDYYRVVASKIELFTLQDTEGTSPPASVSIIPTTKTVLGTDTQFEAMPYAKTKVLGNFSGNSDVVKLKHFFRTDQIFGGAYRQEVNLSADVNNNPVKPWYWYVAWNATGGSTLDMVYKVIITYHVEFFHPNNLAMS